VSPWPRDVSLRTLMQPRDLESHLARIDEDMRAEGLVLDVEIDGVLEDGEPYRIRAYEGHDDLGNVRKALRVATRYGVVMALGPTSSQEALRGVDDSFVPALGEDGTWKSGTDLNGDGLPDVLVSRTGEVEIWGLHAKGASPYPIDALAPLTGAIDVDGDGRPDLIGRVPVPLGDAVAPRLVDVVTFEDGRYSGVTRSARAFHVRQLAELEARGLSPQERVERAWHVLRAGRDGKKELKALDEASSDVRLSAEQRASLRRWRNWLAAPGIRATSEPL
jgi:FG-GAP-like repeat